MQKKRELKVPRYFLLTEYELLSIVVCILLDISEYVAVILVLPGVGDLLDIIGTISCLLMFRLVGIISIFEFVPGADIFPIYIMTWLIWYYIKKRAERYGLERKWL